jgi:hypothetical protein
MNLAAARAGYRKCTNRSNRKTQNLFSNFPVRVRSRIGESSIAHTNPLGISSSAMTGRGEFSDRRRKRLVGCNNR